MPGDGVDRLVNALQDEVGDALRVVAEYTEDGYEARYVRDNVENRVTALADEVHTDLVLEDVGTEHLEDIFEDDLTCSMHRFEDVTAFHFVGDGVYEGLFVSVDSDADVPLATFSDICQRRQ